METRENATHSAFLCELLNPNGSHLKGAAFLELFLKVISNDNLRDHMIDVSSASVRTEHTVGSLNIVDKTGGRIDIYISDKHGNSICIENKIYAGDQIAQLERYCNHNKERNRVIYLNLSGSDPSLESKGKLEAGKDFQIISYKEEVIAWLGLCQKESAETPILRESIRQYILLLKKLTGTMDNAAAKELTGLMLNYFEEASYIAHNFEQAKLSLQQDIRQDVIFQLQQKIGDRFTIEQGNSIDSNYAQIWIYIKDQPALHHYFGIETFNGWRGANYKGELFVGIFNAQADKGIHSKLGEVAGNSNFSRWWPDTVLIPEYEGFNVNLGNGSLLRRLHIDQQFRAELVSHVVTYVTEYLNRQYDSVLQYT